MSYIPEDVNNSLIWLAHWSVDERGHDEHDSRVHRWMMDTAEKAAALDLSTDVGRLQLELAEALDVISGLRSSLNSMRIRYGHAADALDKQLGYEHDRLALSVGLELARKPVE